MRRLSRLLLGGLLGLGVGLLAAAVGGLQGPDFLAAPLVLGPVGILLVFLFQLAREGAFLRGATTAVLGGAVAIAFAQNWLEPMGLVTPAMLVTYVWVLAAWSALCAALLGLVVPSGALGLLITILMLASGSILIAPLAVLVVLYTVVRACARRGRE